MRFVVWVACNTASFMGGKMDGNQLPPVWVECHGKKKMHTATISKNPHKFLGTPIRRHGRHSAKTRNLVQCSSKFCT